jgi:hypothetical protein
VEEIPDRVSEVDAILAWHHITNIDKKALERMKKTKVIVRIGMGFDNVDIRAAGELGIRVCNVPDYGVEVCKYKQQIIGFIGSCRFYNLHDFKFDEKNIFWLKELKEVNGLLQNLQALQGTLILSFVYRNLQFVTTQFQD